ncbi:hypothetical protein K0M31_004714 [Melipona bicolor]|uniref:Uncharacterized protein n=1 Tax=Melipona bicolor TaxID=60889 RepID=A0AA40FVB7_9HYME|nr:hypothetical protein K0M31_004714 [Melipona bicolor]
MESLVTQVARSFDDLDRGVSFTDAIDDVLSHVGLTSDSDSDCVSGRSEPGAYRWSSALGTHVVAGCTCLKGWGHTEREPPGVERRTCTHKYKYKVAKLKKGNAGNKPLVPLTCKLVVKLLMYDEELDRKADRLESLYSCL